MRSQGGNKRQRRGIRSDQSLVEHGSDAIIEGGVPFRTLNTQSARKVEEVITTHASLDRSWIAEQLKIRVRLPSLSCESLPSLFGRNRRVGAGIGIGKDGVVVLVHGDGGRPGGGS